VATKFLSQSQVDHFNDHGFLQPVRVLFESEARSVRDELEQFEADYPEHRNKLDLKANLILPFVDRLTRLPRMLDLMEDLLGSDLLLWSAEFRIKEANAGQYAAWHQDTAYITHKPFLAIGLLALSRASIQSGCLRVIPDSHKGPLLSHSDGDDRKSILTRAQYIDEVFDDSTAVDLELAPGELTVFNSALIHSSGPNHSDDRRIGVLMSYLPTSATKEGPRDTAILVRGEDCFGHFDLESGPVSDNPLENVDHQRRSIEAVTASMFAGSAHQVKGLQ
jgi:hypothetical protein